MLYPKENKAQKKLVYACKRCHFSQEAENPVVFKHELVKSAK
jgi:DNA-directed RNA polymerase II subunit RPB9